MKKFNIAFFGTFGLVFLSLMLIHKFFLIKYYNFEMEGIKVSVASDACESCFLDWPYEHTIEVENGEGKKGEFEFYTEGPRVEFGLNEEQSELLVNCPGFSNFTVNLENMERSSDRLRYDSVAFSPYRIQWVIQYNYELVELEDEKFPGLDWEEGLPGRN